MLGTPASIRSAIDAKYSGISCTEARQQPLEGNALETARGEAIQETYLLGDNAEDVDADLQREPICFMHIPNPVFALSGTSVSVENGEGPSVPKTCHVAGVSAPLQGPVKDISDPILQRSPRDAPGPRSPIRRKNSAGLRSTFPLKISKARM